MDKIFNRKINQNFKNYTCIVRRSHSIHELYEEKKKKLVALGGREVKEFEVSPPVLLTNQSPYQKTSPGRLASHRWIFLSKF